MILSDPAVGSDGRAMLHPDETITYRAPLPCQSTVQGVYIDDHAIIQLLPRSKVTVSDGQAVHADDDCRGSAEPRDRWIMRTSLARYSECKVAPHPAKIIDRAAVAKVWGSWSSMAYDKSFDFKGREFRQAFTETNSRRAAS